MSNKTLLAALAQALTAAATSLLTVAESLPGDVAVGAPTPAPQVTPEQIAEVALDAEGMPWDERIHASTKTQTQKNVWTKRKGVDATVTEAVTAELREKYPAPVAAAPAAPVAPVVPMLTVPTLAPAAVTPYTELVDWLAKNTGPGKTLTDAWVTSAFESNGTTLAELAAPDKHELAGQFLTAFQGAVQ